VPAQARGGGERGEAVGGGKRERERKGERERGRERDIERVGARERERERERGREREKVCVCVCVCVCACVCVSEIGTEQDSYAKKQGSALFAELELHINMWHLFRVCSNQRVAGLIRQRFQFAVQFSDGRGSPNIWQCQP